MTTEDIIIYIFCLVDDLMPGVKKHPQAGLYPSELVTIGILPLAQARLCAAVWWSAGPNEIDAPAQNPSGMVHLAAGTSDLLHGGG